MPDFLASLTTSSIAKPGLLLLYSMKSRGSCPLQNGSVEYIFPLPYTFETIVKERNSEIMEFQRASTGFFKNVDNWHICNYI